MEKSSAGLSQLRVIANNKHSLVCEAVNRTGQIVVVKTPHAAEIHGWAMERLINEANILRHLSHVEGVPALYDFFWLQSPEGKRPMLVIEKMSGTTLQEKRKVTPAHVVSVHECIDILKQSAAVLAHAHSRGIVHTDMKLGNMLVTPKDDISIIDWGTARVTNATPQYAQVIGTAQFMSYEQITNQPLDARTDIYSLGVVLTLLAYGEHLTPRYTVAHDGTVTQRTSDEIADAVARGETIKYELLPKPRSVNEQTFQDVLRTMTHWDRAQRFSTMRELLRAL